MCMCLTMCEFGSKRHGRIVTFVYYCEQNDEQPKMGKGEDGAQLQIRVL